MVLKYARMSKWTRAARMLGVNRNQPNSLEEDLVVTHCAIGHDWLNTKLAMLFAGEPHSVKEDPISRFCKEDEPGLSH